MKKYSYEEIKEMFTALNGNGTADKPMYAVAVISKSSFIKPYTLKERSYMFSSDNKVFKSWCGGYSIFANCLDGKDLGVRLEQYVEDEGGWTVEYCYLVD